MRVIVNADDLGYSQPVNDAIFELLEARRVTSSTLIANAPGADDALARMPRSHGSFGVHLNLTEFRPLATTSALRAILRGDGEFDGNAIRAVRLTPPLREAIFEEWSAQVHRFMSYGRAPSHFDSHHHVHTIPKLFPVLKRLQRRFGIRRVRITKNIYGKGHSAPFPLLFRKSLWNLALRRWYPTSTTDGFTSLSEFADVAHRDELGRWVRGGSESAIEVMVHPGNDLFADETELLQTGWLTSNGFRLLSYQDL